MNPRRGWNPNLEESYLLEYREYEAETQTRCTSGFYLRPVKFSSPKTSAISRYSKCTKPYQFQYLGFFQLGVKLGFDFPGVSPNQKSRPLSLNFDFYEESNPMPGSLKNSFSVKIPNFPQQKMKMPAIKFCFDRKMRPSMESYPSILLLMDYGERPKKVRIPSFNSCTVYLLRLAPIPCYIFII